MLYLFAKPSNVGANVDGLACSLHRPIVYSRHRGGQSLLIGSARSRHTTVGGGAFSRDAKPPDLDILHCVDHLGTRDQILHGEAHLYQGMSIRRQSYHGDYACTLDRVAMSSGDGTDSCTRVPIATCTWGMWPCPVVLDNKYHRFPIPQCLVKYIRYWKLSVE
jgi:hypothetical protein